jgi:hypothetical protein
MKKSILTFAAIALVFGFTSCKETTVESTEDTQTEVIESPVMEEEVIEEVPVEEVDTTSGEEATIVE